MYQLQLLWNRTSLQFELAMRIPAIVSWHILHFFFFFCKVCEIDPSPVLFTVFLKKLFFNMLIDTTKTKSVKNT
jgi:hypothetical protein